MRKYLKLESTGTFYLENDLEKRVLRCVLLVILYFCLKCRTQRSRIVFILPANTTLQCWMCLAFGTGKFWFGEVGLSQAAKEVSGWICFAVCHPAWLCITKLSLGEFCHVTVSVPAIWLREYLEGNRSVWLTLLRAWQNRLWEGTIKYELGLVRKWLIASYLAIAQNRRDRRFSADAEQVQHICFLTDFSQECTWNFPFAILVGSFLGPAQAGTRSILQQGNRVVNCLAEVPKR